MEIIKGGTEVITKLGNIKAIVTACTIRENYVQYELTWFLNGEYKTAWLSEKEFHTKPDSKTSIGFKNSFLK